MAVLKRLWNTRLPARCTPPNEIEPVVIECKPFAFGKFCQRYVEIALQCIGDYYIANRSTCRAHQVMMMPGEVFGKFIQTTIL
jgi:hypothetical protein